MADYRSAVIIIGGVFADDVPKGSWAMCRDADLVLGRVGTSQLRVVKDRHGPPRDIDQKEWDRLYSAVAGERHTLEVGK